MPQIIHPTAEVIDLDQVFGEYIKDQYNDGHFSLDTFAPFELVTNARERNGIVIHDHYSIGGWNAGVFARKVFQGPLVEGPSAFVFEKGTMISLNHYDYEKQMLSVYFEEGTKIKVGGHVYQIHFPDRPGQRNKYPELNLVAVTEEVAA